MTTRPMAALLLGIAVASGVAAKARAHCDTTRGPVITAARAALEAADVSLVLHWVRAEDEASVREAFQHTLAVRVLGPQAKALADHYFFETLVRIHRAGEGAPYTGLSDAEPEPIIAATDRALARGNADELEHEIVAAVTAGLHQRFEKARAAKGFRAGDVAAGRTFVAAYVALTHWVEGVHTFATEETEQHEAASGHAAAVHETGHAAEGRGVSGLTEQASGGPGLEPLPWFLAAALALAALVQGALLIKRRRHAPA